MKYVSSRGGGQAVTFSEALEAGLAPDGGLYVPEAFPSIDQSRWAAIPDGDALAIRKAEELVLTPFLAKDRLASRVGELCQAAFNFPVPLRPLDDTTALLELFHGPTAAFKDVGARFLAACVQARKKRPSLVVVATSGDTGGAVAGAFHGRPGIEVAVLFPKGRISRRQELQLTTWGGNVKAFAVRGSFDDCQRLVKAALGDAGWRKRFELISANSISMGRILPQAGYYALASVLYWRKTGVAPGFIVPTGNLGNAVGALWAKRLGFPIEKVILACNANRVLPEFLATGRYEPRASVSTLANAMDVGSPSNLERLRALYPEMKALREDVAAVSVSDEVIRETIRAGVSRWGQVFCPHTATAVHVRETLGSGHWIVVATAHPAKFESIVEPLIGRELELPAGLREMLSRKPVFTEVEPRLSEVWAGL